MKKINQEPKDSQTFTKIYNKTKEDTKRCIPIEDARLHYKQLLGLGFSEQFIEEQYQTLKFGQRGRRFSDAIANYRLLIEHGFNHEQIIKNYLHKLADENSHKLRAYLESRNKK